jgi:hypothetical protein
MRYILKRDNFLTKDKVNEVFKNELTWGGSLFGRLINSSIRKAKIEFKKAQIDEVLNQIEATIYEILRESLIKDDRVKYYRLLLKSKYAAIKDVSLANDPNLPDYDEDVDCSGGAGRTKFSELIGQDPGDTTTSDFTPKWRNLPSGLIDDLLNDIETLDEVGRLLTRDQKEKLRDIHSDFAVELRKCRWIKCNNKFPGGDEATTGFWLGKVPITDADKELKSEISVKNESLRNRRIFSKFSEFEMYKSFLESSSSYYSSSPVSYNVVAGNSGNVNQNTNQNQIIMPPYPAPVKKNKKPKTTPTTTTPPAPTTTTTTSTSTTTSAPTTTTTTTSTTTTPGDTCNVSKLWKWFFDRSESKGKDLEPLLRLSRDDEKELEELQSRLNAGTLTLDYNIASDAIIRLLNLLYTAYDIFATEYIPSGRPGGRVSLKTFQEYQKLDVGSGDKPNAAGVPTDGGGTAVIPGFGPWAINVVYKKFQRRMRALHEDQELRKIFANVNFNYPGSEDKFNDSYKYSQSRLQKLNEAEKGGLENRKMGPVLFNLLADLTNPRMCSPQKIDTAWRKYFGQEPLPETAKRESNENSASNKQTPESGGKPCLSWIETSGEIKKQSSYCIPSKASSFIDENIHDQDNGLLENRTGPSAPIYITLIDPSKVKSIKTDNGLGKERKFLPVKITFNTPSVANQYYKDNTSKYSGYTDYTDVSKTDPNIYYGYCAMNSSGSEYWIFYVRIDNYGQIDYQKLKIESQKFNDRRNPNAENPPKQEEKLITYSILKGGTTGPQLLWGDFRDALRYKSDDKADVEDFFQKNIGRTGTSFEDYMKSLLDPTKPANKDRIEEICK